MKSVNYLHLATTCIRSQTATLPEKCTVFTFSYRKPSYTKFDLVVKKVKVNPGSSFEQTMMDWSSRCNIPSFMEINPPVPEKILKGFTIHGHGSHLGHVTQMPQTNFHSPYPRQLNIKFGFDQTSGFREEDV